MKKQIYVGILLCLFFLFVHSTHSFAEQNLQSLIDQAKPGEVIHLEDKVYKGPIILTEPITLIGTKKTMIQSTGNKPVVSIRGKGVHLKNVRIQQLTVRKKVPALSVTGNNHSITDLQIKTTSLGINLDNVHLSKLSDITIKGNQKENGINVLNSSKNKIKQSFVSHVLDGIYIENSNNNTFMQNTIQNSRYGFHLMFSNNLVLYQNISKENYIGAMIMETDKSTIKENSFIYNAQNVNSYGLLLFDTTKTQVIKNDFSNNRIGIKLQSSQHNTIANNSAKTNFIGIQFDDASSNRVSTNTFLGNVNDVQAIASKKNNINKNYWDSSWKVDAKNQGTSIIPYKADPFFLSLTKETPEYQIFFQSPGMSLLQKMLKSPDDLVLSDDFPLMHTAEESRNMDSHSTRGVLLISIAMILISTLSIQIWRKTK
ncbi:hypothetical protein ACS78_26665 [Priestia megaterium]|uniref:right-handed parallel beta-helix repeat-containing protein n=1 Tax=Priestia megaterium TaxID=1404 RepID=UPI0004B0E704|nr:NosD domain-containing protein [Priestia megaterium]KNH15549.1 hypothetical protein ACS78_26665 [Priestia megaterium]